jgi:hypothetical protein
MFLFQLFHHSKVYVIVAIREQPRKKIPGISGIKFMAQSHVVMKIYFGKLASGLAIFLTTSAAFGANLVLESTPQRVSLIELYTSEGCSSCPPAEAWFSKLKNDSGLWKNFVPVAFHVSYWDNVSWRDRFASKEFNDRQQNYAAAWNAANVYTPEFVLAGKELTSWRAPGASKILAGTLKATLDENRALTISFKPTSVGKKFEAHVALLGFDLATSVRGGENSGRKLEHDFVALSFQSANLNDSGEASLKLPGAIAGEKGLAVWVTAVGDTEPVQAVGGWLK